MLRQILRRVGRKYYILFLSKRIYAVRNKLLHILHVLEIVVLMLYLWNGV